MKKDFSRPRIVLTSPTRNTDGAFRTLPDLASNELKYKNLSPGPVAAIDYPGAALKDRQRTEPRMRQYGLNMITNTLQDPEMIKSNNEVAKAQLKKRMLNNDAPGPGDYNPQAKPPIGGPISGISPETIAELVKKDRHILSKLGITDSLSVQKGKAFNSAAPRF